jgi:outer membrane assembly lipoprotein YfiO
MNYSSFSVMLLCALLGLLPACTRKKRPKEFVVARTETDSQLACALTDDEKNTLLKKNPKTMTLLELRQVKVLALQDDNLPLAATYLEHIITQATDQLILKDSRLELADIQFDLGNMDKAAAYYSTFVLLYPGSSQCEYAEYKAILCRFYGMMSCDRDQTKTKEALVLARAYLENNVYRQYKEQVQDIKQQCLTRLFESEKYIFDFHLKQANFTGAQQRIMNIRNTYHEIMPEIEPAILTLEIRLAIAQDNQEIRQTKESELLAKYPDEGKNLLAALSSKKIGNYVIRF